MLHDVSLGDGRCNDALFVSRFFQRAKVHIIFIADKKTMQRIIKKTVVRGVCLTTVFDVSLHLQHYSVRCSIIPIAVASLPLCGKGVTLAR